MIKILFYVFLLILFARCSNSNTGKREIQNSDFLRKDMVENSTISYLLDKQTSPSFYSADYNLEQDVFSFINVKNSTLYTYKDATNVDKVKLFTQGPNGLGNLMFIKHKIINEDTVLMYHINRTKLYMIGKKGNIIDKYSLKNNKLYYPFYSQITPMQVRKKSVFFPVTREGHFYDLSKNKSVLRFNLSNKSFSYYVNYPQVYDKKLWGSQFKYENSIALNGNILCILYPVSDYVKTIDLKTGKKEKHLVKSKFIDDFKPYRELKSKKDFKNHDFIAEKNFSLSESDHTALLYHSDLKLFFVINYLRPSLRDVRNGYKIPDFSVAYYNQNFQKLGERKFKTSKYFHTLIFKHEKGLMIGRRDLYRENENKLVFSIFEFEAIK